MTRRLPRPSETDDLAKATREGRFKGRKPIARAKAEEAKALLAASKGATAVAAELGISRASLWRIVGNVADK